MKSQRSLGTGNVDTNHIVDAQLEGQDACLLEPGEVVTKNS